MGPLAQPSTPTPAPAVPKASNAVVLDHQGDAWSFATTEGRFLSLGVCVTIPAEGNPREPGKAYDGLAVHGGNKAAWVKATADRLKAWGFNTAGAWSDDELASQGLYHTKVVWFGGYGDERNDQRLFDVFSPEYASKIDQTGQTEVKPSAEDPRLLGYFINNELPWYGERGWPTDPERSLLNRYADLPATAPGKAALVKFLTGRYGTVDKLRVDFAVEATDWTGVLSARTLEGRTREAERVKYAFAGVVADQYYRLCREAVQRYDTRHLILGSRFAGKTPRAVVEAMGRHADALSINLYAPDGTPDLSFVRNLHALTGKPVLVTEFSWRAVENRSGNRNRKGAEVTVQTQAERAEHYQRYLAKVMAEPYILGAHWFQYFDQPPAGRFFDDEDCNYGVVDVADRPYEELTQAMTVANRAALNAMTTRFTGPAPVKPTFDEEAWGELRDITLPKATLATAVEAPLRPTEVHAHPACNGTWEAGARLRYHAAGGWGIQGNLALDGLTLAGAQTLEVELSAPAGLRIIPQITESGADAPGKQVYAGVAGADGESFDLRAFMTTGDHQVVRIDLNQGEIRRWWGNPRGNRRIDLNGMKDVAFLLPPQAGDGTLTIHRMTFTP